MLCNLLGRSMQTDNSSHPPSRVPLFGPLTRWWLLVSVSEAGQRPLCQGPSFVSAPACTSKKHYRDRTHLSYFLAEKCNPSLSGRKICLPSNSTECPDCPEGPESSLTVQIILEGEWEKFFLCVGNPFRLSSFPEISPGLFDGGWERKNPQSSLTSLVVEQTFSQLLVVMLEEGDLLKVYRGRWEQRPSTRSSTR
ncbi:hypothetical protein CEXT_117741 [Caerostris extrusa]|uniref:Uncharacterized protein n=1 Tax=Caerostris extrusa TaxID=172846 RepID=A0AAV4QYE3_CAEEX|nr:hypothetical protein CEXT_117741 [Caerostris extrusa]